VVRNGQAQPRKLTLGAGTVELRAPRCMSSEPFGQVGNGFKRGSGPSELSSGCRRVMQAAS
jgi:hypothetical protein